MSLELEQIDVKAEFLKASGVDIDTADLSLLTIPELWVLFDRAWGLEQYYAQISVTEKTFMNSIYGATGSAHYEFSNFFCAEDITGEGRFYIQTCQDIMNAYLRASWHLDTELHEKLKELFPGQFTLGLEVQLPQNVDYVIYIDTDSIYVEFDQLVVATGFTGCIPTLIVELNNHRFRQLFQEKIGNIIKKRHGEDVYKFDLENTSAVGFFIAKKKYLLAKSWEESKNIVYDDPSSKLTGKGIVIAQKSFSQLTLKLIKHVLSKLINETLNRDNYKMYMLKAWETFSDERVHLTQCAKFVGLNKYNDYVVFADETGYETGFRALPQHKGASRFNHLILKHGLAGKYEKLKNGQKVGIYLDTNNEWFAFPLGDFPDEIAPPINRRAMFDKVVRRPLEQFALLAGYDVSNSSDMTQCMI